MNTALAHSVPPAFVIPAAATSQSPQQAARHQTLIRGAAAITDVVLEDLTPQNIAVLQDLVEQFRVDLVQYQANVFIDGGAQAE
ncbi:hypothetical protein KIKIMORA_03560 [Brevundimonas phage vB_BpoS-Kikimora]|uniref:Uncharacterized protein n=1 Tax=Brevundimonas phage vB_BpoS-Kikimora TaxID=2948601 RepID=A0A9E7MRU9_9CAUD|nr:hypothetical protein KIKIMORA_03560 [Brevundimonas phage vB_BpoS-Kikimora]